jgi:hypothetical protein
MSLINKLKPFCIWHRIRRDNRFESRWNRKWGLGNPQLFSASSTCIMYSMGVFAIEIFLLDFPFKGRKGLVKSIWDFSGVKLISAVSLTPLKFGKKQFFSWCPYELFHFAITVILAVSLTPLIPFQRRQLHRWNRFSGVNYTVISI